MKERERNGKGVAEKESIRKRKRKGWKEMVARKRSILEPPPGDFLYFQISLVGRIFNTTIWDSVLGRGINR